VSCSLYTLQSCKTYNILSPNLLTSPTNFNSHSIFLNRFALLALYTKTCIGLGYDDSFDKFMKATGLFRYRGFQCFVGSLGSFTLSFLMSLHLNFDCWPVLIIMILLAEILREDTVLIMKLASDVIYSRMKV